MLTFSVNEIQDEYIIRVKKAIEDNIGVFRMHNPSNWDEAIQRTYETAINNRNDRYEDLGPYIRALASKIMLGGNLAEKETIMSITDIKGEVTGPFLSLVDVIDTSVLYNSKVIDCKLKELYLKYPEDFIKLERLYKTGTKIPFRASRGEVIENVELKKAIKQITGKHGVGVFFNMLYLFLKNLPEYLKERPQETIKEIIVKKSSPRVLESIPDIPLIRDVEGNLMGIEKETLTMESNPDFIKWDLVGESSNDIMRIDISPLVDYMYQQIYVPQGVNTKHIVWCDTAYKLKTIVGVEEVNIDREVFMQKVRVEIIENLIENRVNTIIAVSPDTVYIKARREFVYNILRVKIFTGKIIDIPVSVHKKNRM